MRAEEQEQMAWHAVSPYIRVAHVFYTHADMRIGPTRIVDHALHYFKEGEGTYEVEGEPEPVRIVPGMLFLIRPGVTFSFSAKPGTAFHMLNLHFDIVERKDSRTVLWPYPKEGDPPRRPLPCRLPLSTADPAAEGEGLPTVMRIAETAQYESLFYRILEYFGNQTVRGRLQLKSRCLELLAFLWQIPERPDREQGSNYSRQNLQQAVSYMQSRLQAPVTLDELARAAHMSKSYFVKCFREQFRISPIKFHRQQRLEHAKCELVLTLKPIKMIAEEIGCDSIHQFYHLFSREVGCSPGTYRQNNSPFRPER